MLKERAQPWLSNARDTSARLRAEKYDSRRLTAGRCRLRQGDEPRFANPTVEQSPKAISTVITLISAGKDKVRTVRQVCRARSALVAGSHDHGTPRPTIRRTQP